MAETLSSRSTLRFAVLGAASFLALHLVFSFTWELWFTPAALEAPWFLGSKPSIVVTQVGLGLVALVVTVRKAASWRRRLVQALALVSGVMMAVSCVFFAIGANRLMLGPPRLWPWVLLSAFLLLGPAILAGTLLGGILRGRV
ncbi:MAG: hypothetical protein OES47_02810 [Acidobacteriota bacterium]|nr:hypothetical protein [Acidobacteriota bacterium]